LYYNLDEDTFYAKNITKSAHFLQECGLHLLVQLLYTITLYEAILKRDLPALFYAGGSFFRNGEMVRMQSAMERGEPIG
jgi:hypothetical protein